MKIGLKVVVSGAVVAAAFAAWPFIPRGGSGVEAAAETLAQGLSSGRLDGVKFEDLSSDDAQGLWDFLVAGMGETPHEVDLVEVRENEDGGTATATLSYAWDLGERSWTYRTTAHLARADDGWAAEFDATVVEPSLGENEVLDLVTLAGERGDIVGAGGTRLVTDRPVVRFGIDKTKVVRRHLATSARDLAKLLGIDASQYVERVAAAGDKAFVEAIVLRRADVTTTIGSRYESIPGTLAMPDEMPLAPTRQFARPILGTVGPVTAEIIEDSGGEYEVGDQVGLSGLQQRHDDTLTGSVGLLVRATSEKTGDSRQLFKVKPGYGESLRVSLDTDLQLLAEQVLSDVAPASALVAIRPSDGHILAAASGPGGQGYPTATLGHYAPGSTFKVVTSLALLRAGLSPETVVRCTGTTTVNGKSFKNYDGYPGGAIGDIDLRTALAESCNTAFIHQRDQITQADLADAAAALGLGQDHDLGFPAYFGSVPGEAPETGHAASMIGQGKVLASPMAMAAVAASVAEGRAVVPTLLPGNEASGPAAPTPLTDGEATALREMMRAVVTDGSAGFLADIPGEPVLAKTGTAEFGTEAPLRTHAWMIARHGDLAVAAFVEVGDSGSTTAGPLLESFLRGAL